MTQDSMKPMRTKDPRRIQDPIMTQDPMKPMRTKDPRRTQDPRRTKDLKRIQDQGS